MTTKTELYNQNRRKSLIGLTIGFGVWWGTITLNSIFPEINNLSWLYFSLTVVSVLGSIYWITHLLRMQKTRKELKNDPELARALNDEFYQHIRLKSFTYAFSAVILVQALLIVVNTFYPVSTESVLNINILVGVITPVTSFLLLENAQQYEESQA